MRGWTDEELDLLVANYNDVTNEVLAELLPNRSPLAIYKKAYKVGLRKTPEAEHRNRSESKKGIHSGHWNGGRATTSCGYKMVLKPNHPKADKKGYVLEHILVWEQGTGVSIPPNCCIHHINGNKADNRIENLCMMQRTAHTVMHHTGAKRSDETKAKISAKAKARLADKRNHPRYKEIDVSEIQALVDRGETVERACKAFGINKTTFYKKRRYEL